MTSHIRNGKIGDQKMPKFKVTYAIDYLDPKPLVKTFDSFDEAQDFVSDEVQQRIDIAVQHSQYYITEKDHKKMEETEHSLCKIEEV